MSYFRRGRHRRNRFSVTVAELIAECSRIPIDVVFVWREREWAKR